MRQFEKKISFLWNDQQFIFFTVLMAQTYKINNKDNNNNLISSMLYK